MSDDSSLVTAEGVDEGSSASATESSETGASGVLGAPGVGTPANEEQDAEPHPVGPDEPVGPGQRLQVGEG